MCLLIFKKLKCHGDQNLFLKFCQNQTFSKSVLFQNLLLFGLVYITEAEYFRLPISSYITCHVFAQGDPLQSQTVYNSIRPNFNFYKVCDYSLYKTALLTGRFQKVPFLYDEPFLECMRDNSMVIEVRERGDDAAVGVVRVSLHQFYITYRNSAVTQSYVGNRVS